MQSDSATVENGPFRLDFFSTGFSWPGPSSYRQSSRFYSFRALPRGGWCEGVPLYSSRNRLAALCIALSPRATARRTLVPANWWLWAKPKAAKATFVELHSADSRQSCSSRSRCWQHGIDSARCCPSCDTSCWRAELGMRHADLLREATAGIAKPASAPCMIILQCGTWYVCVAVWRCGCVLGGGMSDAIGSKSTCKTFSTEFVDCKSSCSTGSASRNSQWKKVESIKPFFDRVRKPDLGFSRKRPRFRLTNPIA